MKLSRNSLNFGNFCIAEVSRAVVRGMANRVKIFLLLFLAGFAIMNATILFAPETRVLLVTPGSTIGGLYLIFKYKL